MTLLSRLGDGMLDNWDKIVDRRLIAITETENGGYRFHFAEGFDLVFFHVECDAGLYVEERDADWA